jgi:hypothetical protein
MIESSVIQSSANESLPVTGDRFTVDVLAEALVEALETMAFISAEPLPEGPAPCADTMPPCRVRIGFVGPFCAALELDAPRPLGAILAANVLAVEPEDPEAAARAEDSLLELGNVVCGLLVRKVIGRHGPKFEVRLPTLRIRSCACDEWEKLRAMDGTVALLAEGLPLMARMECPPREKEVMP